MNKEVIFSCRTRDKTTPYNKPRVYFTCHPKDFDETLKVICGYIHKTHDCAIFYTEDMTEEITEENNLIDLERMNLFVVPVVILSVIIGELCSYPVVIILRRSPSQSPNFEYQTQACTPGISYLWEEHRITLGLKPRFNTASASFFPLR